MNTCLAFKFIRYRRYWRRRRMHICLHSILPVPEDLGTKSLVWGLINIYFFSFLKQNMFSRAPSTGVFFNCRVKTTYFFLQSCKKICFFQVYGTGGFHNNIYSELKEGPPYSSVVRFSQFSWPLKFSFSILWCFDPSLVEPVHFPIPFVQCLVWRPY